MVAPGYPEEVISECVPPDGYPDTWRYKIWLQGQWSNLGNISKCIDPNLCYDDPPGVNFINILLKPSFYKSTLQRFSPITQFDFVIFWREIIGAKVARKNVDEIDYSVASRLLRGVESDC